MAVKIKISIAMATYNGSEYLLEQLNSLSSQTLKPDEIIISDDVSNDRTLRIISDWAAGVDFEVKVLTSNIRLGYTNNFNKALSHCTGDLVFICDQDDVWLPNKLQVIHDRFCSANFKVAIHDLAYCNENMEKIGQTKLERIQQSYDVDPLRFYVTGMATAIEGGFLRFILTQGSEKFYPYDCWIHEIAFLLGKKVIINDVLADYRRHDSNATASDILNTPNKTGNYSKLIDRVINPVNVDFDVLLQKKQFLVEFINKNKSSLMVDFHIDDCVIIDALTTLKCETSLVCFRREVIRSTFIVRFVRLVTYAFNGSNKSNYKFSSMIKDLFVIGRN